MEKKTKNKHNKTNNKQNERRCRERGEGEERAEEMGNKKPGDTITKLEDLKMVTLEQLKKPLCMLAIAYR